MREESVQGQVVGSSTANRPFTRQQLYSLPPLCSLFASFHTDSENFYNSQDIFNINFENISFSLARALSGAQVMGSWLYN